MALARVYTWPASSGNFVRGMYVQLTSSCLLWRVAAVSAAPGRLGGGAVAATMVRAKISNNRTYCMFVRRFAKLLQGSLLNKSFLQNNGGGISSFGKINISFLEAKEAYCVIRNSGDLPHFGFN